MDWSEYPRFALIALLVLTNLGLVVAMSTSSVAYGPYNSGWDGGSDLRTAVQADGADATISTGTEAYVNAETASVAFVFSPVSAYSPTDISRIRQFVSRGGTLVVASERPQPTNDLLDGLDVDTRVNGTTLRDDRNNYRNASLPRATNVSDEPLVDDVDALTLNRGTVLDIPEQTVTTAPEERPRVLVRSSSTAYLDRNENGTLDDDEQIQSYPVAAAESVGSGRVIVVSDASVVTNAMLEQEGNAAFTRAVSQNATTAVLDYSQRPPLPPLTYALLGVRSIPAVQVLLAVMTLGGIAVWARRPSLGDFETLQALRDSDEPDTDGQLTESDIAAFVREQHPEWDPERVERVSQHIIRQRKETE